MRRLLALLLVLLAPLALAQDARKQVQKYQQMIAEGSPAELFELEGEALWKKSFQKCDLGRGPGVLKGAYAALPRYFKDADRVMDLETRLVHCMTTLQGRTLQDATKRVFGNEDQPSELEYLSAYVAGQSRGMKMAPGTSLPQEKASIDLGRRIFVHRAGAWDFSCESCHGDAEKRIRMQYLPELSKPQYARPVVATWPAYLVRNAQFKTMQWRMNDCYRQMRMPEPNFGSEATVALIHYLTATGAGEAYRGPGTKR